MSTTPVPENASRATQVGIIHITSNSHPSVSCAALNITTMRRLTSLIPALLFFLLSATAQEIGIDPVQYISPDDPQRSYDQFALELSGDPELQKQKGWKYIARWIDFANRHTTGRGMPPETGPFAQSIVQYSNLKRQTSNLHRSNPWSPAGPFNAPESVSDYYFTGTGRVNTITFHPTDPDIMWIGGGQGGLWKTTNRAASWFPIGDDLPVMRISDIEVNPYDPDEMYICIGDYAYLAYWLNTRDVKRNTHFGLGVYKTSDGGTTWEPTGLTTTQLDEDASLFRRTFIHDPDDNVIVAAGITGIYRSEDRGVSWSRIMEGEIWDIERDPSDPDVLYASTGYIGYIDAGTAALWKSDDFGQTWVELNTGIPAKYEAQRLEIAISPADNNVLYIAACNMSGGFYGLYRSTDAGQTWDLRSDSPNILHWYSGFGNGGQGTYDLTILTDDTDTDKVYVGGINQWVSEDGGETWQGASHWTGDYGPGVHADHHFIAQSPHDGKIYLCHDGGVSRTDEIVAGSWEVAAEEPDYEWPTVWEDLNEGLANNAFYRLGISQTSDNIYAGAQDMGTYLRDGGVWSYNSLGDGMECIISPYSDDVLYGSSQYGNIFKSDDRGFSFSSLGFFSPPWQNESAEWTTPYVIDGRDPYRLYVPAANVYVSEDEGFSFEKISEFSDYPISAFAVSPGDPLRMYVGKRVWYGNDQPGQILIGDGVGWSDITAGSPADSLYITFLEVDDDDPERAWATFAGFAEGVKVFETSDAGETWQNISYNLPNLPANCIVQHDGAPHNPLYVGLDRGIWYKNDTMDQWMLYSEGLPNVIIQDFDIHYADGLLYTATFGRGIWVNNLLDNTVSSARDILLDAEISLAPNPSSGPVTLGATGLASGRYNIQIVNTTGQIISDKRVITYDGNLQIELERPALTGLYYVRLISERGMRSVSVFWE